jgi:hypothetical protein
MGKRENNKQKSRNEKKEFSKTESERKRK